MARANPAKIIWQLEYSVPPCSRGVVPRFHGDGGAGGKEEKVEVALESGVHSAGQEGASELGCTCVKRCGPAAARAVIIRAVRRVVCRRFAVTHPERRWHAKSINVPRGRRLCELQPFVDRVMGGSCTRHTSAHVP